MNASFFTNRQAAKCIVALIVLVVAVSGMIRPHRKTSSLIGKRDLRIEMGDILVGQVIEKEVDLYNGTGSDIELIGVSTSCACTQAYVAGKTLAKRGATKLHVAVGSSLPLGRRDVHINLQWRRIHGSTKESDNCVVVYDTVSSINLHSEVADFGELNVSDAPRTISLDVSRGNSSREWDGLDVVTSSKNIVCKGTVSSPNNRGSVLLTLNPSKNNGGRLQEKVEIYPKWHGRRIGEVRKVLVTAELRGDLEVVPRMVRFTPSKGGASLPIRLVLRSQIGNLKQSLALECTLPLTNESIVFSEDSASAVIEGHIIAPLASGPFIGKLMIKDGSNAEKSVSISLLGYSQL